MSDASQNPPAAFIDAESLRRWPRKPPIESELPPPRFSLATLLAIVTAAAIYFGLMRALGNAAVAAALAVLCLLYVFRVPTERQRTKQLAIDLIAGIALPLGCIVFDPGFFREPRWGEPLSVQIGYYSFLGGEMFALFVWLLVGTALSDLFRGAIAGILTLGWALCVPLGLLLSLEGLLLLVEWKEPLALLAAVPWFAFACYRRNAQAAKQRLTRRTRIYGPLLGAIGLVTFAILAANVTDLAAPAAKGFPPAHFELTFPKRK